MPIGRILAKFNADVAQCDQLIASAHRIDGAGVPLFSHAERVHITHAAFLNLFIAWEAFLEDAFSTFMIGYPTLNGTKPIKYVHPRNAVEAQAMVIGVQRFFDYANVDFVRKLAGLYFRNGYPFEPHLGASQSDLADMRTLRNASAHVTSSTQRALESLAQRILTIPSPGITLYTLLTSAVPGAPAGQQVYGIYRDKLKVACQLIATG